MNNILMASSTADEMNAWAKDLDETFKSMPNITKEQFDILVPKIRFVSDKFMPVQLFSGGLNKDAER